MKRLLLVRHAKSDWNAPRLSDRERPLNPRGERDAPEMGKRLALRGIQPGRIISSNAVRAMRTAHLLALELGVPADELEVEPQLYACSVDLMLRLIQFLPADCDEVLLVGHNPESTACANLLGGLAIDNMPTCAVVALDFPVTDWQRVLPGRGRLLFLATPKNGQP